MRSNRLRPEDQSTPHNQGRASTPPRVYTSGQEHALSQVPAPIPFSTSQRQSFPPLVRQGSPPRARQGSTPLRTRRGSPPPPPPHPPRDRQFLTPREFPRIRAVSWGSLYSPSRWYPLSHHQRGKQWLRTF